MREAAALDELWESRPRPVPLPLAELLGLAAEEGGNSAAAEADPSLLAAEVEKIERAVLDRAATSASSSLSPFSPTSSFSAARALGLTNDHARWPAASWARLFVGALSAFHALRPSEVGAACFDKDDRLGCELVCAGAALRAAAYRIGGGGGGGAGGAGGGSGGSIGSTNSIPPPPPPITVFDAKGMAGNIVHALATTNAVVAGLIVAEALKLVSGAVSACRVTWIRAVGSTGGGGGRLLVAGPPPPPAAGCAVCGSARLELECDPATFTLSQLVDDVLKGRLALIAPSLICGGGFYWEDPKPSNGECDLDEDEVEQYSRLLPLALSSLPGGGFGAGTVVAVKDQAQAIDLHLLIVEKKKKQEKVEEGGEKKKEGEEEEEEARFVLRGAAPVAAEEEGKDKEKKAASPSSSSDLEILPEDAAGAANEVPAVEPEVPDAVDAAEGLAAEEARERKEAAAAVAAAATATAAEPASAAAAAEEEREAEQQQPSAEEEEQEPPPPTKRPRRAAADKGRETVREALRENAKGGRGDRKRKTK